MENSMTLSAAVVTTFPTDSFEIYSRKMLESYCANWPAEIPILVRLDDDLLVPDIKRIIREQDAFVCGYTPQQKAFLDRNKDKDDPQDYRKQACRFSHKIFTLKAAADYWMKSHKPEDGARPRYLIWMDADVLTTKKVLIEDIQKCLPKEGDAVSYMGRKDWDHSECGWLVFDLENGGWAVIDAMLECYKQDTLFALAQWHDSFVFDEVTKQNVKKTNLTANATGMDVWPQSPMAPWSRHYKGPIAKHELTGMKPKQDGNGIPMVIQTKNSIPDEQIHKNILENQAQIKNWIMPCVENNEEIVIVSAGEMLVAEDLLNEVKSGRKIVAVKHALDRLKAGGITPWACILLDPREHVTKFTETPDKDILWFVASQVTPKAVKQLLDAGCNVWGYHASVGAGEDKYTLNQPHSIVDGGSATATRGLFVLDKLGFRKFRLYGYELCLPNKPSLSEKDEYGQPKYFEVGIRFQQPHYEETRGFWSKGELLAQSDEFQKILQVMNWNIKAFGNGIIPFLMRVKEISDLRKSAKTDKLKINKSMKYEEMLGCKTTTRSLAHWLKKLPIIHRKQTKAKHF